MHAEVSDEIIVRGRHVGDNDRKGVITEVHGEGGAPPYLVRWENGHDSVFMPSSDTVVEHRPAQGAVADISLPAFDANYQNMIQVGLTDYDAMLVRLIFLPQTSKCAISKPTTSARLRR